MIRVIFLHLDLLIKDNILIVFLKFSPTSANRHLISNFSPSPLPLGCDLAGIPEEALNVGREINHRPTREICHKSLKNFTDE